MHDDELYPCTFDATECRTAGLYYLKFTTSLFLLSFVFTNNPLSSLCLKLFVQKRWCVDGSPTPWTLFTFSDLAH